MNFKRMARLAALVFTAAEWEWGAYPPSVPGRKRIQATLRDLYLGVEEGAEQVETGRLIAIRSGDEHLEEIKVCLILGSEEL